LSQGGGPGPTTETGGGTNTPNPVVDRFNTGAGESFDDSFTGGEPVGGGEFGAGAAGESGGGFDFEAQSEELLSGFDEKFLEDLGLGQENFLEDRENAAANFDTDIQRFLDEFRSDQDRRQQDYLNLLTDQAAKASEFDPEKFRSTLLELESSRRRQKDWNERSAKQAYKY
jgi:hypothetical protein